jgi:pimeloyl-ACP methyl ester carboxylesterase
VFVETAALMDENIPDVECHIIANCGHMVPLETPELFNDITLQFLENVSE